MYSVRSFRCYNLEITFEPIYHLIAARRDFLKHNSKKKLIYYVKISLLKLTFPQIVSQIPSNFFIFFAHSKSVIR